MVKFSFENLNLVEMLDYITKLLNDVSENEKNLKKCKRHIESVVVTFPDMSEEEKRLENIKVFFQDKLNRKNLLKYSKKQKQLKKKLQDLEIYLINKGFIRVEVDVEEQPDKDKAHYLHYYKNKPNNNNELLLLTDEEEESICSNEPQPGWKL